MRVYELRDEIMLFKQQLFRRSYIRLRMINTFSICTCLIGWDIK